MTYTKRVLLSPRLPMVSRLAFGSLTVSPMQTGLPLDRAAEVISYAFDSGINLIDTAQYYENYHIIREGLKRCSNPDDVVISTKTYAYSRALAIEAVEEARRALGRDVIDIFMLHEQESYDTMRGHFEALEYLLECRERGIIKAVGASTHHVALLRGLLKLRDDGIMLDVCHPLYNMGGIGIADGGEAEMAAAIRDAHSAGIGIYAMKVFGGGHLSQSAEEALSFVFGKDYIDAAAVGMQSIEEVDANLNFLMTGSFSDSDRERLKKKRRTLHVEEYCEGCGACVERCTSGALRLEPINDTGTSEGKSFTDGFLTENGLSACGDENKMKYRAAANDERCVRCGYCTKVCPVFALKVY